MAKTLKNQVSMAGGEWSPKLDARVDQQKYSSALRQQLNMISYKSGGSTRRPGSEYIAAAKKTSSGGNNYSVRLVPFIFSPTTTFVLEFGDHYIRFYSNGVQVPVTSAPLWVSLKYYPFGAYVEDPTNHQIYLSITTSSSTLEPHLNPFNWVQTNVLEMPVTPYSANAFTGNIYDTEIWQLRFCQINDEVFITHPDYPVWKLTRIADTDWTFEEVKFLYPALLDQNATDTVITPSAVQGDNITLTATAPAWVSAHSYNESNTVEVSSVIYQATQEHVSAAAFATDLAAGKWKVITVFDPDTVFSTWQLATLRNSNSIEYTGTAAGGFSVGVSTSLQVLGSWEVHSYGVWSADVAIERSLDQGLTWDTVKQLSGRDDRNVDWEGKAELLGIYRINVSNVAVPSTPGATDPRIVFECVDALLRGLVKIMSAPTAYTATANVVKQLYDPNPIEAEWVSGFGYTVSNVSSYEFVNYTCISNITGTTPPPRDSTHWRATTPGGTTYWSESAWSEFRGFPHAVASFQQRVIYGATYYEPQRIWGTVINDIENFDLGDQSLATYSFAFDLNAVGRGPIQWLLGQTNLFVGFSGAEWVVTSGSTNQANGGSGSAITPGSINAVEQSTWGSPPNVSPATAGDALLFTQRQTTSIRQMLFSIYTNKYMSQDLTTLSDHLFAAGIAQIAYQARWRKQSIVWAVTQQGSLCGMTYELDQEVFGWHRHQTGFDAYTTDDPPVAITPDFGFESVCVIDGQDMDDDEVWVVANRIIGGVHKRYIERLNPNNWEENFTGPPTAPAPNFSDAFYVDSGITVLAPGTLSIGGLSHLEGRYVVGLADGLAFGPILVASGVAVLPDAFTTSVAKVQIGLPIPYACQPMRLDQTANGGNTQGLVKAASDLYLRLMNSAGGSIANGTDGLGINQPVPINYRDANPLLGPTPVTDPEDKRIQPKLRPSPDADPIIIVQGQDAYPITVLALIMKMDVIGTP